MARATMLDRWVLCSVVSGVFAAPAVAQETPLFGVFSVRESADDKNKTDKPASFFVQWPDGGEKVYSLDLAVSGNVLYNSSRWSLEPTVELHRKSDIEKPQDTRLYGAKASGIFGDPLRLAHYVGVSVQRKENRIKHQRGLQAGINYLPLVPGLAMGASRGSNSIRISWQPAVALEREDVQKAPADAPTGAVSRLFVGVDLYLYPLFDLMGSRLELLGTLKHWSELSRAASLGGEADSSIMLRKLVLTWFVDGDRHLGLGLDRVDGVDVTQGLEEQRYWQLAVKLRF